jgi:hypothetical protein
MTKFVTLKQIADALQMSECSVRRKKEALGLNGAKDRIFKNRFIASKVKRLLRQRDYDVDF